MTENKPVNKFLENTKTEIRFESRYTLYTFDHVT